MRSLIGGILVALVLMSSGPAAQNRTLVLEGGTLIDGTGNAPIADAVVVVEGNRITAVGRRGQVTAPPNANVIRLDGRTILPGLIDTHVHLIDWHLPMFLPYGVTTITDLHNDTAWDLAQRTNGGTGSRNSSVRTHAERSGRRGRQRSRRLHREVVIVLTFVSDFVAERQKPRFAQPAAIDLRPERNGFRSGHDVMPGAGDV